MFNANYWCCKRFQSYWIKMHCVVQKKEEKNSHRLSSLLSTQRTLECMSCNKEAINNFLCFQFHSTLHHDWSSSSTYRTFSLSLFFFFHTHLFFFFHKAIVVRSCSWTLLNWCSSIVFELSKFSFTIFTRAKHAAL